MIDRIWPFLDLYFPDYNVLLEVFILGRLHILAKTWNRCDLTWCHRVSLSERSTRFYNDLNGLMFFMFSKKSLS